MDNSSDCKRRYPLIILLIITVIWGINTPVMKFGLMFLPPILYNAYRFVLAAVLSAIVLVITKSHKPMPLRDFKKIVMLSILGLFFNQIFIINGMTHTTAGNASLLFATLPVEVSLINWIFRIESITKRMVLGIITGLSGVFLVILGSDKEFSLLGPHLLGALLIIVGQFCYGGYTVFIKELNIRYSAYQIFAYVMALNAILFLIIAYPEFKHTEWSSLSNEVVYSIIFSSTFALVVGNSAWIWVVGRLGSTKSSLSQYVCPLISIAFAWFFLDETFGIVQFAGAVVVLLGLYLTLHHPSEREALQAS